MARYQKGNRSESRSSGRPVVGVLEEAMQL